MQTTKYSCGPAALATVLQNMGFNVTEQELKVLAGTDVSGTTMHGMAQAAKAKGLSAAGMKISTDELRPNNIVHVTIDGTPHYSVVREVTENSVKLADPSLGNIELTREKFSEIYTGNALVMEAPGVSVNETSSQTNNTDASVQSQNSQTLTAETMKTIRGKVIWKGVAAGVAWNLSEYLLFTPRNRWSQQGVGWAIVKGVISGVFVGKVGIAILKSVLRKAIRLIPWKWRWRLGLL